MICCVLLVYAEFVITGNLIQKIVEAKEKLEIESVDFDVTYMMTPYMKVRKADSVLQLFFLSSTNLKFPRIFFLTKQTLRVPEKIIIK